MEVIAHQSTFFPKNGIVNLQLFQHNSGYNPLGRRLGFDEESNEIYPTPDEIVAAKKILELTKPDTLSIIPLQKGIGAAKNELVIASLDRTIVCLRGIDDNQKNITYIATKGELIQQEKITLSTEDQKRNVKQGNILNVFRSMKHPNPDKDVEDSVSWAILNCHDYTNVAILNYLLREKIELLLIVSSNPATRLYWEYAISDIHRLFCFIAISNIAEIGGSAVFAPFRTLGEEVNAKFRAGGQLFSSRGNSEFEVDIPLNINELRRIRHIYSELGLVSDKKISDLYTPIIPSEHFLHTFDRISGSPLAYLEDTSIQEHKLTYELIKPKIAIAQLKDIGFKVYVDTMYRIRNDQKVHTFCDRLRLKLKYLEEELAFQEKIEPGRKLDFLVFPEVFIPRNFLAELQDFSNKHQTTIICGVDYPDGKEDENSNQCFILQPDTPSLIYTKITRSQYDAISINGTDRMPLSRGNTLLRFLDPKGRGFGLLICYDFSHIDLLTHLNLSNRLEPLEFLFVIAHNPFSKLYKSCCIADSHRFYQYIIMCNVSDYGGSGVFGPIRTKGERQTILDMGIGVEAFGICELDIEALIKARQSPDEALHFNEFMRKPGLFQKIN